MSTHRAVVVLLAVVALVSAVAAYLLFIYQVGFPDGHRTDLDRARIVVSWLYIVVSLIIAGFSARHALAQNPISSQTKAATAFFVAFTLIFTAGIHLLAAFLDSGTGG